MLYNTRYTTIILNHAASDHATCQVHSTTRISTLTGSPVGMKSTLTLLTHVTQTMFPTSNHRLLLGKPSIEHKIHIILN